MRKNRKSNRYRMTAAGLAAVMAAGAVCTPVQAAPPRVEVDESLYVNMDHYGEIRDISVVKGCFLNGNTIIEDYGDYDEIINMSDRTEPTVENGKVTWNLENSENQYFYYECRSEDLKTKVPWDIDVSYRLNGVEARGEELGGAQGLISTRIHVTPKKDIDEYHKNNMILICGTLVDMKNTLSIEAPGAQLQTMGTEKAALFLALPGEESDFRIDVGTDHYESMGLFFMVVPVTLDALEVVNDVREVRETVEDSADAMDAAMDAVFDNIEGMKDDLESVERGLEKAERAHQIYDGSRESMEAQADAAIASLENVVTYLKMINTQAEADQANLDETIDRLTDMMRAVGRLNNFGSGMTKSLGNLNSSLGQLNKIAEGTVSEETIGQLQQIVGSGGGVTIGMAATAAVAEKVSKSTGIPTEAVLTIAQGGTVPGVSPEAAAAVKAAMDAGIPEAIKGMGYDPVKDKDLQISGPSGADVGLKSALTAYIATLEQLDAEAGATGKALLSNSKDLTKKAENIIRTIDEIAVCSESLADWTDEEVREDLQTLIAELTDLAEATEVTISATQAALSGMRETVELTEDTLASSLTLTLNGLSGVMQNGIGMADNVGVMKNAKNTIRDTVDRELNEIEAEHNFLNTDVTASFPSFTSEKNQTPASIQIILRTAEISADDGEDNAADIEVPAEDIGMWGRFKAVFVNLREKILGIFR